MRAMFEPQAAGSLSCDVCAHVQVAVGVSEVALVTPRFACGQLSYVCTIDILIT